MHHSSQKGHEIFQNNRIFRDVLQMFLENKRIFSKGVRDFYRVIRPSGYIGLPRVTPTRAVFVAIPTISFESRFGTIWLDMGYSAGVRLEPSVV